MWATSSAVTVFGAFNQLRHHASHRGRCATHDPKLVERAERVTAEEVAGTGTRWAFAPCIAVPQNERWGRTYEGYSDNTALVAKLGPAAVVGLQGGGLSANPSVLACAKHFIGDGGTSMN